MRTGIPLFLPGVQLTVVALLLLLGPGCGAPEPRPDTGGTEAGAAADPSGASSESAVGEESATATPGGAAETASDTVAGTVSETVSETVAEKSVSDATPAGDPGAAVEESPQAAPAGEATGKPAPAGSLKIPADGIHQGVVVEGVLVPRIRIDSNGDVVLVDVEGFQRWAKRFQRQGDLPRGFYDSCTVDVDRDGDLAGESPRRGIWRMDEKGNIARVSSVSR